MDNVLNFVVIRIGSLEIADKPGIGLACSFGSRNQTVETAQERQSL
jgi:hypothetical protein